MTKKEFIAKTAKIAGFTQNNMEIAFNAFLDGIITSLNEGESVTLNGIGKFIVKDMPECQRRNPSTGEAFTAPAKKRVSFKVSNGIKTAINE